MKAPRPSSTNIRDLEHDLNAGRIKVPQFQRKFVWNLKKCANLFDSIIKGYPVGALIYWKTRERFHAVKNIGNLNFAEVDGGDYVQFVLDGQQRITTLLAAIHGEKVNVKGRVLDFSRICVNLNAKDDDPIIVVQEIGSKDSNLVKLCDLCGDDLVQFAEYDEAERRKLQSYRDTIVSHQYPTVTIEDATVNVATEIFERINVEGQRLTLFEIMVAKTYDEKEFDLAKKFDDLINELQISNYETISNQLILQIISLILSQECKPRTILKLSKDNIIKKWDAIVDALKNAIDYFRDQFRISVSDLLPYPSLLGPFTYFFYHHPKRPTGNMQKYLVDFFWRVSLSRRYSSAAESNLAKDIKSMDIIMHEDKPNYDWGIDSTPKFIRRNGKFSPKSSYNKAILCIYVQHQPKSFADNTDVNISNNWLRKASSKNYHHFFPKAYLRKNGIGEDEINHIANITIIHEDLNKMIGDNPPSEYMSTFNKNSQINSTMKTHLIDDLADYGIWADEYDTFLTKRIGAISSEIQKRIIAIPADNIPQPDLDDDPDD